MVGHMGSAPLLPRPPWSVHPVDTRRTLDIEADSDSLP